MVEAHIETETMLQKKQSLEVYLGKKSRSLAFREAICQPFDFTTLELTTSIAPMIFDDNSSALICGSLAGIPVPIDTVLIEKLFSFAQLERGWNEYNAPQVEQKSIDSAASVILDLYQMAGNNNSDRVIIDVFPTNNGGIQIEAEFENRSLEVEFSPTGCYYLRIEKGDDIEKYLDENRIINLDEGVKKILNWLLGR